MSELKVWPYREAEKVIARIERQGRASDKPALFETGYGPSGLPHIGTFAEVARTTWVQAAYEQMTGNKSVLWAFSDDMDGLRGVPDNIPNKEMLRLHLGKPLCEIPDPFGQEESFSGYMNAKLRSFLDQFGFDYEFKSSKDQYRGGVFNDGLLRILETHDEIKKVILPTLGQKKGDSKDRSGWSPFMPVCTACGKVYTTSVTDIHPESGEVSYRCDKRFADKKGNNIEPCNHEGRTGVTDGKVKVGWKVDWALRWYMFGVDYEMYGKDLIESASLSGELVKILGGQPPEGFFYEMFLDENGQKISKTKGNGLEVDEWLTYGPLESLSYFIFQTPTKARKLHFDVIPKAVDGYLDDRAKFSSQEEEEQLNSPIQFLENKTIREGGEVEYKAGVTYSMLLNLVSVLNTDKKEIIWEYLQRYSGDVDEDFAMIDRMIDRALGFYTQFVVPTKEYVLPSEEMMPSLRQLVAFLESYEGNSAEELQKATYAAGKENGVKLGKWFATMYRLLLGQERGPRLGTFMQLYGVDNTLTFIKEKMGDKL